MGENADRAIEEFRKPEWLRKAELVSIIHEEKREEDVNWSVKNTAAVCGTHWNYIYDLLTLANGVNRWPLLGLVSNYKKALSLCRESSKTDWHIRRYLRDMGVFNENE